MKISVSPIKNFPLSGRTLCLTDEAGTMTVGVRKDGSPLSQDFTAGALALIDRDGSTLVDPIDFTAVLDLCQRIVEGDQRAATQPSVIMTLAAAYLAIALSWPVPMPPTPLAAEEAA